jgi:hypothetical protein
MSFPFLTHWAYVKRGGWKGHFSSSSSQNNFDFSASIQVHLSTQQTTVAIVREERKETGVYKREKSKERTFSLRRALRSRLNTSFLYTCLVKMKKWKNGEKACNRSSKDKKKSPLGNANDNEIIVQR